MYREGQGNKSVCAWWTACSGEQSSANFRFRLADPSRIFQQRAAFSWTGSVWMGWRGISRSYPSDELFQISWGYPKSVKDNFHESGITFLNLGYPRSTFPVWDIPGISRLSPNSKYLPQGYAICWPITGISLGYPWIRGTYSEPWPASSLGQGSQEVTGYLNQGSTASLGLIRCCSIYYLLWYTTANQITVHSCFLAVLCILTYNLPMR